MNLLSAMKYILIISIFLAVTGCVSKNDPRIIGTFISDKDTTLNYLEKSGDFDQSELRAFSKMLGRIKIECDGRLIRTSLDDHSITEHLNVIRQSDDSLILAKKFLCDIMHQKVLFTEDGYWLIGDFTRPEYREKFIRIKGNSAYQ